MLPLTQGTSSSASSQQHHGCNQLTVKLCRGSPVIFPSEMGQDLLLFPARRQEEGHAVVETEGKLRAEVIWVYHLVPDGRWAELCNLPPHSPAGAQPAHNCSAL